MDGTTTVTDGDVIRLPGAPAGHDRAECQREDPEIASEREVLDVLALDGEPLIEVEAAAAEHLHRAGQARLDDEPEACAGS